MNKVKARGYGIIKVPLQSVVQIVKIMEPLGYNTLNEFCKEAIREHIRHKMTEYDRTILE